MRLSLSIYQTHVKVYTPLATFLAATGVLKSDRSPSECNKRYERLSSKLEEWVYQSLDPFLFLSLS